MTDINSSLLPLCIDIEDILKFPAQSIAMYAQLALLGATLIGIGILIQQYLKNRIAVHGNLLLLFTNIIVLYIIHTLAWFCCFLRYRILYFIYQSPCDLLTPMWMVILFYGPYYLYSVAYPAFHFCVMVERLRATILAAKYESERQSLGIKMAITIWIFSLGYLTLVIVFCLADQATFGHPLGVLYLTSKYNADFILCTSVFILVLVIFTAFCDWRITVLNKRIKRSSRASTKNLIEYSLARNYQLNENALTMQLILPLDVFYAIFYALHAGSAIVLRAYKNSFLTRDYVFYYYLADTFLFLHTFVTIIVYIRFLKFVRRIQRRDVDMKPKNEEAKIYFRQLQDQWAN